MLPHKGLAPFLFLLLVRVKSTWKTGPERLIFADAGEEGIIVAKDPARAPWKIGYQVHSCNSLSEWPNLVRKGARSFKVDPRWLDFDGGVRCADPTGCLVLSHDPPLPRLHHTEPGYYSFLDDVLIMLSDVEPVRSVARQEGLRIALCFKGVPHGVCGNDSSGTSMSNHGDNSAAHEREHAARWLQKVDAFVEGAKNMLATQELEESVEFVLDGGGVPVNCLAQRWRPWRSVYMNGSAPAEAFVSDEVRDGSDRFQVLNEPADTATWQYLADPAINYGKFSAKPYPYQLWEPGSQADIQALVGIFRQGRPHEPGLHFATNSDAAMFQVYAGLGLNQELREGEEGEEAKKVREEDTGGLVTLLKPGLALVLLDRRRGEYRAYAFDPTQPLSSSSGRGLTEVSMSPLTPLTLPGWESQDAIQTFAATGTRLLVSTVSGEYFLYDLTAEGGERDGEKMDGDGAGRRAGGRTGDDEALWLFAGEVDAPEKGEGGGLSRDGGREVQRLSDSVKIPSLRLRYNGSFQRAENLHGPSPTATWRRKRSRVRRRNSNALPSLIARTSFSSVLLPLEKKQDEGSAAFSGSTLLLELYIDEAWQQQGCRLAYKVQKRGQGELEDNVLIADKCLWRREDDDMEEEEEGVVVQSAVAVPVQDGEEDVILIFVSAGGKLFMTDLSSGSALTFPSSAAAFERVHCMVQIGVAHSVAASTAAKGALTVVMLVSGGGFCYNSHIHNTGPFNVCRLTPQTTAGVLDYTYGTVTQWLHVLRGTCEDSSTITKRRLVTACDADLLHGSYDLGYHPSLALFPTSIGGHSNGYGVGMLEVHRGFTEACPIRSLRHATVLDDDEKTGPVVDEEEEERGSDVPGLRPRCLKACECGPALVRPKGSLVADSFPLELRGV